MDVDTVMNIGQQAMEVSILLTAPILGASLAIGLLIAMFQAATQINEMTLTFVPKLAIVGGVIMFAGHWMISQLTGFTIRLIENIPYLIG